MLTKEERSAFYQAAGRTKDGLRDEGFPPKITEAFLRTATIRNAVVSTRVPGKATTTLIEERYDLKGYQIKAKSCNWGPMSGFLCKNPAFNKKGGAGDQPKENGKAHVKYIKSLQKNFGKTAADAFTDLKVSDARKQAFIQALPENDKFEPSADRVCGIVKNKDDVQQATVVMEFLLVQKVAPGWVEPTFSVEQAEIPYNSSATLKWSGTLGASYTLTYLDPSSGKATEVTLTYTGGFGSYTTSKLTKSTIFTLHVTYIDPLTHKEDKAERLGPVSVAPPPPPPPVLPEIICFEGTVETVNGCLQLTLNWETENADHVEISSQPTSVVNGRQNANGPILLADQSLPNSIALKAVNKDGSVLSQLVLELQPLSNSADMPEGMTPVAVAASRDGEHVFVAAHAADVSENDALLVVKAGALDSATDQPVPLGNRPKHIAVSADQIFVTYLDDNKLTVLDAHTFIQKSSVPVRDGNQEASLGMTMSPDEKSVYVLMRNWDENSVVPDENTVTLTVFDEPTLQRLPNSPIPLGEAAGLAVEAPIAVSTDLAFVALASHKQLTVVDAYTCEKKTDPQAQIGEGVQSMVVSPDGKHVFAVNGDNALAVLDVEANRLSLLQPVSGAPVTTILAPIIKAFSAAPVYPGGRRLMGAPPATTYTPRWETEHADGCAIDPGVGSVEASGEITVQATTKPTTYTLTCTGQKTVTASVTITIALPPY